MRSLVFSAVLFLLSPMALADQTIYQCAGNDISIVKKVIAGDKGQSHEVGLFMLIFGDLAQELQAKHLYPTQMVPGSTSSWGLYWTKAFLFKQGEYGASVRIANISGPFFHYYFKSQNSNDAVLEVWQTAGFRSLNEGVGNSARLVFKKTFTNCR